MLITLCYSVLTWIQSRQRSEISGWVQKAVGNQNQRKNGSGTSIVCLRRDFSLSFSVGTWPSSRSEFEDNSSFSSPNSTPSKGAAGTVLKTSSSALFSPEEDRLPVLISKTNLVERVIAIAGSILNLSEVSDLCWNFQDSKLKRILWEEETTRGIVLSPTLNVNLHDWISFREEVESEEEWDEKGDQFEGETDLTFQILLEAESNLPYVKNQQQNRKFTQFGKLIAWRYNSLGQFALIIESHLNQLIDLMHIFRLGIFILEGGWKVHRLSTIKCEGTAGTLISLVKSAKQCLSPGDLRKLSLGIFENSRDSSCCDSNWSPTPSASLSASLNSTPKCSIPKNISKHDITTINEEFEQNDQSSITSSTTTLANWFERSPKKRAPPPSSTLPPSKSRLLSSALKPNRRFSSFCSGSDKLATSSSLTFLRLQLQKNKSMSLDEEDEPPQAAPSTPSEEISTPTKKNWITSSKSFESLSISGIPVLQNPNLLSPSSEEGPSSRSLSSSPRRLPPFRKSPQGKTTSKPNILILSESEGSSNEISSVLRKLCSKERYAIYNIRWDQLEVGGWSEQTALLVVAGDIPKPSFILQYLGDGGRLLAWCCKGQPFGPAESLIKSPSSMKTGCIQYGPTPQKVTRPLNVSGIFTDLKKVLETTDSEGYARPMSVSVFGAMQGSGKETVVVGLDGGALGGKAILSQIPFEKCIGELGGGGSGAEEDSLALLAMLLTHNLGIDCCSKITGAEFTQGFLLGDHLRVRDFLSSNPATVEQPDLTLEFVPRGEKGSRPSHLLLPVYSLACPINFSSLHYYNTLESKELGRLVIYTDTITSTMNVLRGHSLLHGLTIISARQTNGKGRGKNVWLSPEGAASFSVQLIIQLGSQLGQRISLIQHIAALAVVLAIPEHKELNLGVKWPNDIYASQDKIGGILVESRIEGQKVVINIGIGINVINPHPTVCLNSLMNPDPNPGNPMNPGTKGNSKNSLKIETVIAKTLNKLEELVDQLDEAEGVVSKGGSGGVAQLLSLYEQNWIHSREEEVSVEVAEGTFATCRIEGIDPYGFLRVVQVESGNVFSVRPDGNSFDITNKLIAIKQ